MAEVTAGGHLGGWPPERDVLLATKLHVPRSRPGLVTRPRLADLLDEGADRGLVLAISSANSAPATAPRRSLAAGNSG